MIAHGDNRFCNPSTGACSTLRSLDIFGERIDLTFEKKSYFQTNLGAAVSIFCLALMAGFLVVRTAKLASDEEPFFSSISLKQTEAIDLWKLGFMFAIQSIPREIGTI